jgi:hypothetical protein
MLLTLCDKRPSTPQSRDWLLGLKKTILNTENEEHPGRPTQAIFPEDVDAIIFMNLGN